MIVDELDYSIMGQDLKQILKGDTISKVDTAKKDMETANLISLYQSGVLDP